MKAGTRRIPVEAWTATIHELFDEAIELYEGDLGRWEIALDDNVWVNFEWIMREAGPNEANLRSAPSSLLLTVRRSAEDRPRFNHDTR